MPETLPVSKPVTSHVSDSIFLGMRHEFIELRAENKY